MALHLDDVSTICASKETWKLVVRVVRLWTTQSFNGAKLPFSLEMVLVDSKGSRIQASIRKTLIYKFQRLLIEGHVYCLSYFGVGDNNGSYRYTRHAFKLNFQFNTRVQEINDSPINVLPYSFVPLSDIIFNEHDTDFLVDVIGILTGVGTERQYQKDNKKQKILCIELDADGVRIECALFGNYVDEIGTVLASADMTNAVVVIQFAKVKPFKGKTSLQNVYGATKITFNPEIEEATRLKEKFFETYEQGSQVLSQLQEPAKLSIEDDFLKATVAKTIEEVKDMDERCVCVIIGTIKHIPIDSKWWYNACKCKKKVTPDEDMYFCEACNKHITTVYPRYRLQIRVIDENDSASLVIFDDEAMSLLEKTCADLVNANDQGTLPDEINKLLDRTLLFKIDVNNCSTSKFEPSYRVKRICADPDIINHYKAMKSGMNTVTPDMSLTTPTSDSLLEGVGSNVPKDLLSDFVVVGNDQAVDLSNDVIIEGGHPIVEELPDVMQSVNMKEKMVVKIKQEKE